MYPAIALWARAQVLAWYRVRHLGRAFPATGPVLLVANHTNGLADGALLMNIAGDRPLRFLVKYKLFRVPVLGWICRGAGCIPVYRRQDGVDTSKNSEAFAAVYERLGEGQVIAIFPEGTSRTSHRLRELKSGVARMALGAEAAHGFRLGLRILPVGVAYPARDRWRSRCDMWVGEGIAVDDLEQLHASDARAAIERVMQRVAQGMRSVTVNLEGAEDLPLLALAERLDAPDGRSITERRVDLAEGYAWLREHRPERATELSAAARCALAEVPATRDPRDAADPAPLPRAIALGGLLLCSLPWIPPVALSLLIGRALPLTPDKRVTVTLLSAQALAPLWAVACGVLLAPRIGLAASLAALAAAVLAGFAAAWFRTRLPAARPDADSESPAATRLARELARLRRLGQRLTSRAATAASAE